MELQRFCVKEWGGVKEYYNVTEYPCRTANIWLLCCDASSLHLEKSEGKATVAFAQTRSVYVDFKNTACCWNRFCAASSSASWVQGKEDPRDGTQKPQITTWGQHLLCVSAREAEREGRRHPFILRKHIKVNGKSQNEGLQPWKGNTEKISVLRWSDRTAVSVRCSHGYSKCMFANAL